MSFLNPVNEPVKRFKSTDAGAPQINYNARTAGDVKAVLKACLVTGYGSTAAAGWSIVNEVDHVCEFVSPSAAMSDYRLGIDDTAAQQTVFYYKYQNAHNATQQPLRRNFNYINHASVKNGWQMLVTQRGFILIDIVLSAAANDTVARILYFGALKSAIAATGVNISFFLCGYNAQMSGYPSYVFQRPADFINYRLAAYNQTVLRISCANLLFAQADNSEFGISDVEIAAELFVTKSGVVVARHPGLLLQNINSYSQALGVSDTSLNGRNVLKAPVSVSTNSDSGIRFASKCFLIPLDHWEY